MLSARGRSPLTATTGETCMLLCASPDWKAAEPYALMFQISFLWVCMAHRLQAADSHAPCVTYCVSGRSCQPRSS